VGNLSVDAPLPLLGVLVILGTRVFGNDPLYAFLKKKEGIIGLIKND
jgi:hypothetical protein